MLQLAILPIQQSFGLIFRERFFSLDITATQTSLIVHLNGAITSSLGLISGPMMKRFTFRRVAFLGGVIVVIGICAVAFAVSLPSIIITYCLIVGIGHGIMFPATNLAMNTYFRQKRNVAMGLSVTLTGLGPILMPLLIAKLLEIYDTTVTLLIIAGIAMHSLIGAALLKPFQGKEIASVTKDNDIAASSAECNDKTVAKETENVTDVDNDDGANCRLVEETLERKTNDAEEHLSENVTDESTKEEGKSILKKITEHMDLALLEDGRYVAVILGMAVSLVAETNFNMMIPFVLTELSGLERDSIATVMSIQAISDIIGRLCVPLLAHKAGWTSRNLYVLSLIGSTVGRTSTYSNVKYSKMRNRPLHGNVRSAGWIDFSFMVITYQLARCQGGGPSTFGYDASSACSKPYSRAGRARFANLPCDFRQQNWCTVAGSSYPWHAVRRFVQENQGLMRRMYGDERHINVLRAEFEKNDIELKDDYYYDQRKYQYTNDYDYYEPEDSLRLNDYEGRSFTSRSFNDNAAKRLNKFPKLSEYTRPHFRPTEKTTTSTSTTTTTTTSAPPTTATYSTKETSPLSTTDFTTSREPTTRSTPATTSSLVNSTNGEKGNTPDGVTVSPVATSSYTVREQNFSINEISEQIDKADETEAEKSDEVADVSESSLEETSTINLPNVTELPDEGESVEDLFATPKETTVQGEASNSNEEEEFRPRPEYRPVDIMIPRMNCFEDKIKLKTTESIAIYDSKFDSYNLFFYVRQKYFRNACPVKEEVVAPFWANNTRGEVLALLNLYPFEQYVHWEKCTHENKQMYCRDGCRCEQQYRLHRLLAYDPNNECVVFSAIGSNSPAAVSVAVTIYLLNFE
ncbi:Monocarboxylate transporter 9 [Melipona quadrifasciata]|uniref:Monocarboxylate transporter 9 n=1 Tax=Melipona quadrifasciata TaxID=166423 RepID=A0A0M8ZS87_9HYME|nr:Monocarboxylate transporter 9 [Melipona quadrifasciata]